MVKIKRSYSYLKNLKNVTYDIDNFLNINKGNSIYISVLTKKPKLIISKGFFYYTNGDLVSDKNLYIYYSDVLNKMKDLSFTLITECDNYDFTKPENLNIRIVDCINEISALPYDQIHNILLKTLSLLPTIKFGRIMKVGESLPKEGIRQFLKYNISKNNTCSFILRNSNAKDDIKNNNVDSYLFLPINTFVDGKIKVSFMLNEKPIE